MKAYKEESCGRLPRDGGMGPASWLSLKSLQIGDLDKRGERGGKGEETGGWGGEQEHG